MLFSIVLDYVVLIFIRCYAKYIIIMIIIIHNYV